MLDRQFLVKRKNAGVRKFAFAGMKDHQPVLRRATQFSFTLP
jgi:hypothetical protein